MDIIESIKFFGGITGLITFIWKLSEEFKSYVKIRVKVLSQNKSYSVYTGIENNSKSVNKKIDNAFLIISPENSDILGIGNKIGLKLGIRETFKSTNEFSKLKHERVEYIDNQIAYLPLDFYYNENVNISDEILTFCCSIDDSQLGVGKYSVRFYVYCKGRLHRSTQDLLVIE